MKRTSLRKLALTVVTLLLTVATNSSVMADSLSIHIGPQAPPQPREDHQWAKPYRTAVWIAGHNEWRDGGYVWIGGYYAYPPHEKSRWIAPRYPHGQDGYSYRPGYWTK